MSPLRAALESALAENPDDLASHMAYADLLVDEGDPRASSSRCNWPSRIRAGRGGATELKRREEDCCAAPGGVDRRGGTGFHLRPGRSAGGIGAPGISAW